MKGKLSIFARKTFALVIAISMSFPTGVIAAGEETKTYDQATSIMGLNEKPKEDIHQTRQADNTDKLETDAYIMEARASLDQDLEKISYQVTISNKHKETSDKDLSLKFTPNPNSNITDIKVKSAKAKIENKLADIDIKERSNKGEISSLIVDTKAYDEIIMEVEANVRKAKDARTYETLIGLDDGENKLDLNYRLITNKETVREENQEKEIISLDLNKDPSKNLRGEIKSGEFLSFLQSTDALVWTDYLVNTKAESENMTYDLKLDDKQDTKDSKITLDYFENTKEGFILKKEFSQAIDFADKIEFEIPAGYIAKLSLTTRVDKKNTKTKSYRLNNREVKNPIYIEGNKESSESDDEEGGEDDHHVEIKPEENKQTEDRPNKEEQKPMEKEKPADKPTEIKEEPADKPAEKKAEKKEEKQTDTQITAKDSAGKDIPVIEKESKEENKEQKEEGKEEEKEEISALALNKDSLITRLAGEGKLSADLEKAIEDLAEDLDAYNQGKISDRELKDFTKALGHRYNIEKSDLRSYLESILSGLNKEKNKAANLNYDEIIAYAYPEKKDNTQVEENKKTEEKVEEKTEEKTEVKAEEKKDQTKTEPKANHTEDKTSVKKEDTKPAEASKAVEAYKKDLAKLKEAAKKEEKKGGLIEGIKGLFGQTDLAKADKELKKALANDKNGIEEIQNLLNSFEKKYKLSRADQARLMENNNAAIEALVEKDRNNNFRPHIFAGTESNKLNLEDKKFHILTRFDTSNATGPIQPGQFFRIHLDKELTVKPGTKLEPIKYKGEVIAKPEYKSEGNIIEYKIVKEIKENTQFPLNIPVDYNPANVKLDDDGTFTVINKVSGLGLIDPPKDLLPQKVDVNGNPAGSIIEPGRKDVTQIIEAADSNYKMDMDAFANPVIKDGELQGYNWTVKISSDTDLSELGFKANFTAVKGSGLGEISSNDTKVKLTPQLQGAFGIHDSKHHAPGAVKEITYNLYTPVQGMQEKYMMDISVVLTKKTDKAGNMKVGAKRFVVDGWPHDKVKEDTPVRVGINNRTTILGKFASETSAEWTVTDGVSTGDEGTKENPTKLPWETRKLSGNQTITSVKRAVYHIDSEGKMAVAQEETRLDRNEIPTAGTNPSDSQAVGNIAVYEINTSINQPEDKKPQTLAGVAISKYQDVNVEQNWNLGKDLTMPKMTLKAVDSKDENKVLGQTTTTESEKNPDPASRRVTIPNVKVWNIENGGKFSENDLKIKQDFPTTNTDASGNTINYYENNNFYDFNKKGYYIHNKATVQKIPKFANFTLIKKDEKGKPLPGASFKLLGQGEAQVVTDKEGKAQFSNIAPGTYTLMETKAPKGYKLNQERTTVSVDDDGRISTSGSSAKLSVGTNPTVTVADPNYPDYMNAMQYATKDEKGNVTTYIFLKANEARSGGSTNKDTRISLRVNGGQIENPDDVQVYDVNPDYYRDSVRKAMTQQTVNQDLINLLGPSVLNAPNNNRVIRGTPNQKDPHTGQFGYEITLPKERFARDWGFLVVAKSKPLNGGTNTLSYDWFTSKNTGGEAKLQNQTVNPTSIAEASKGTTITVTNEAFETRPVEIRKIDKKEKPVVGATFEIKDENDQVISTVTSQPADDKGQNAGLASFGKLPEGKYTIEEIAAPEGYVKSDVIFEVTVDDSKQVTYKPKFKDGKGSPVNGEDYLITDEEQAQEEATAKIKNVSQSLVINEGDSGDIGVRPQVWEAYRLESLKYNATIDLDQSSPGQRFSIQFDRNLDFTQYFGEFPKLNIGGVDVADPYFDYTTNKLTYVFNDNSIGGNTQAKIELKGIIPSKYFAQNDGTYNFTVTVAPGQKGITGQQTINTDVVADYEQYDYDGKNVQVPQSYYFRDVYKGEDGKWYVAVLAYYNPVHVRTTGQKELKFNWLSTNYQGATKNFFTWEGNGNKPAFSLRDVKIYRTSPNMGLIHAGNFDKKVNYNMPLSYGVRPSQDPAKYNLVYSKAIDPRYPVNNDRQGSITLNYDPGQIQDFGVITKNAPLKIKMPAIDNRSKDGYIIEQTFKIDDLYSFNNLWRVFCMTNNDFKSSFITRANYNKATGDQAGGELPKFFSQKVALLNKKYVPGSFKIKKLDESDRSKTLQGASFSLTDKDNNVIYRTSGQDGIAQFSNLKPGIYTLKEEKAPDEHIKSDKTWRVNVGIDGVVTIIEIGLGATGESLVGKDTIELPVTNKPVATEFKVYKKDDENVPLQGAKFKITTTDGKQVITTGESDKNGIVSFDKKLENGTYLLEEEAAPAGFKKLDKKWVIEISNNKARVYNYIKGPETGTDPKVNKSILGVEGTKWVNVSKRPTDGWNLGDNRQSGYYNNYPIPFKLGTRIVGKNTKDPNNKYVIQRYVINPEADSLTLNNASIHREKPWFTNMDWYAGNGSYKIFELDKAVDGNVEDIRLENYSLTDITSQIKTEKKVISGDNRLYLDFKDRQITKPIVIDVKIPYTSEDGGVGTGMDLQTNKGLFWKSDYYRRADRIVEGDPVVTKGEGGNIKGAYISEGSLDVNNEKIVQEFSFKKVDDGGNQTDAISGATFSLKGPKKSDQDPGKEVWKKSGKDGMVKFDNLTPGIYHLTESGAPQGYEKSNTDWTVTVTNDGKIYIKDNNPGSTVPDQGAKWQKVKAGTSGNKQGNSQVQGTPVANRLDTRITEVNKKENKFRQVFIINKQPEDLRNAYFEIHAQPPNRPINEQNTKVVSLVKVERGSTPDSLNSPSADVEYDIEELDGKDGQRRIRITPKDIPDRANQALALTIESTLGNSGSIGTGIDFVNFDGSNTYWMAESYDDFSKIQLEEATSTGTNKNAVLYTGGVRAAGRNSIMEPKASPKPVLYSAPSGLMARSFATNRLQSMNTSAYDLRSAITPRSMASTFADGLELGDELVGDPVRAGGWEEVIPSKSEGAANVPRKKDHAETKITEINKQAKRFKQIFILKDDQYLNSRKREIQIHRQPEDYAMSAGDTTVKLYKIGSGSTLDNIIGKTDISSQINKLKYLSLGQDANGRNKPNRMRFYIERRNNPGPFLVEVETSYNPNYGIGLGTNYYYNSNDYYNAPDIWVADSYNTEAGINKNVNQEPKITYEPSSEITEIPIEDYSNDPSKYVDDPNLPKGQYRITDGEKGSKRTYYLVEYKDGVATGNKKIDTSRGTNGVDIIKEMTPKLRYVGTKDDTPSTYTVWVNGADNGSIEANPNTNVAAGTDINITVKANPGYELDNIVYYDSNLGRDVEVGTSFKMPAFNITLRPTFKQKQANTFNINIIKKDGGTVTTDVSTAKKGDIVKINITPDQGWQIESMNVVGKNGGSVADINQFNKTFTMPAEDVWVQVTFKKSQTPVKTFIVGSENDGGRGAVSVDPTQSRDGNAKVGEKVTFTLYPYNGYKATNATVKKNNGVFLSDEEVHFDPNTNKGYFIMPDISPATGVTVRGVFESKPYGERTASEDRTETLKKETKVTIDPNLAPGEKKVDKPGADGEVKTKYTVTYNLRTSGKPEATAPADWPADVIQAFNNGKGTNEIITAYNKVELSRKDPVAEEVRVGKSDNPVDTWTPGKDDHLIVDPGKPAEIVKITNKKAGITLKILKRSPGGEILPGAKFTLHKMTDSTYSKEDTGFGELTASSNEKGDVIFKNGAGNVVKLQKGYYVLRETKAPTGHKKSTADWKIEVKDDGGRMYAEYQGPESSPSSFINDNDKSNAGYSADNAGIKYKSRLTFIDTESKTYIQRIYIDTRAYNGETPLNLQITPKYKREEIDTPGAPPKTIKDGVKTAYFTAYKLSNPENFTNMNDPELDKIIRTYDLANDNMSMIKTARWRPFDWGFDEDQLNLDKGVYIVDVEGFYDDVIITGKSDKDDKYNIPQKDLGKLDLHVDFYSGERQFKQLVFDKEQNKFVYKAFKGASYQGGAEALRQRYEDKLVAAGHSKENAKKIADEWAGKKDEGAKYANFVGKEVELKGNKYKTGYIDPAIGNPTVHADTSVNLNPLYNSKSHQEIPREGLEFINEEETFNITFSKHGRKDSKDDVNSEKVTKNRLEGAVFRLEVRGPGGQYEPMPGTTVASAFNGYFGFRGLKPGRYRLMEVKAPEGYKPIKDPVLHFTVAYEKPKTNVQTGEITPGRGVVTLEYNEGNGIFEYAPDKKGPDGKPITPEDGKLVDYVTSATAKNMGKIINEVPGKGKVTLTKYDDDKHLLPGAEFKLTRISRHITDEDPNKNDGVYTKTVGQDGKIVFDELPIGQYELEETKAPKGYQNKGKKWRFTVGGVGLDPYINDSDVGDRDISKSIEMTSKMSVLRPDGNDGTENEGNSKIHPHKGHALSFDNTFKIKDDTAIKAGDYFTIKLTDNIDLEGIMKEKSQNLDLFADGVGTIAKAKYDKEAGTLTYVFTSYADQYNKTDFANTITAHINLMKVKNSTQNVQVGMGIKDTDFTKNSINVDYDLNMAEIYGLNMTSKIVSFDRESGEFVQYFYINRNMKSSSDPVTFRYKPSEDVKNLRVDVINLKQNGYNYYNYNTFKRDTIQDFVNQDMPKSFGVDESSNNLNWHSWYGYYQPKADENVDITLGPYSEYNSFILKVTGQVDKKDIASYDTYAKLFNKVYTYDYYGNVKNVYEQPYVERTNGVRIFENKTSASAKLEIDAINPKNEINFKKIDQDGKILQGAKFKLERYYENTQDGKNWVVVQGSEKTSDKDGLVKYEKLEAGKYALIETEAPEGYGKIEGHIVEFTVGEDGVITRQVVKEKPVEKPQSLIGSIGAMLGSTGDANTETVTEPVSVEPIDVVNYKEIEFEKVDANDKSKKLEGAEFEVHYKEKADGEYQVLKVKKTVEGKEQEVAMTVKSGKDGKFRLPISKDGHYALVETKAPGGYTKVPGKIREFKLENGKVQTYEKDPIKASHKSSDKGQISSEIISYDKDKKTFRQRIIINPNHKEITIPSYQSYIRIKENDWKITPKYGATHKDGIGGEVNVAILKKNPDAKKGEKKSIAELEAKDYREVDAVSFTTAGNITGSRYGLKDMLGETSTTDEPLTTTDAIVMEFSGKLDDNNNTGAADQLFELIFDSAVEDNVNDKLNVKALAENKPIYADHDTKAPIQVENKKAEYPFTKSVGTAIFTAIGLFFMVLAGYYYSRKKNKRLEIGNN
ncbi:SpaA isopeptide-forming pilin-related protein [uncultured Anaerococcus sp.]|uniref:SpaA isopeptide-forming pilin-related protein n=1 Tax=uncultured Anaerococcus sp. TaxID=293428 RepID=UPI00261F070F|nr:SpaA isopeptide-forming pilin-related protein [uncultured Anaerococcus sp.]